MNEDTQHDSDGDTVDGDIHQPQGPNQPLNLQQNQQYIQQQRRRNQSQNEENTNGNESNNENEGNNMNNYDDDYSVLTIPLVDALLREGLNWEGRSNSDSSIESGESDIGEGTSGEREEDMIDNSNGGDTSDADVDAMNRNPFLAFLLRGHRHGDLLDDEDRHSDDDANDDADSNVAARPARDHAYLPTAQPLYPEEWIPAGRHRMKQQRVDSGERYSEILATTETLMDKSAEKYPEPCSKITTTNCVKTNTEDGSFHTFPHYRIPEPPDSNQCVSKSLSLSIPTIISATIVENDAPILLQSPSSTPNIILAILEIDDVILFPGSTLPLRLKNPKWIEFLGELIDDARGLFGTHSGTIGSGIRETGEVRIGILPRIDNGARRTRRQPRVSGGRPGRWRIDLIRRGVVARRRTPRRRLTGDETENNQAHGGVNIRNENTGQDATSLNSEGGRAQTMQIRTIRTDQAGPPSDEDDDEEDEDEFFHPTTPPSNTDPFIGRIGTMATITFTHEEAVSSSPANNESGPSVAHESGRMTSIPNGNNGSPRHTRNRPTSMVWQRHRGELVVTALGTNRFRIISSVCKDPKQNRQHGASESIPLYAVEVWNDGIVPYPPTWAVQLPGSGRYPFTPHSYAMEEDDTKGSTNSADVRNDAEMSKTENIASTNHSNAILNLSIRSSTPYIAYRTMWPWKIANNICGLLQETEQLQGLRSILPLAPGVVTIEDDMFCSTSTASTSAAIAMQFQVVDPSAFANWLASNMPLSQNDRLDLLDMFSTVEQLRYVLGKIRKQRETLLRCKHCGASISQIQNVFTVGGAEGTTGNYVNEHGIVHQTVTLRKVDNHSVVCIGRPETKDSWFPGYSWTIAYCAICSSHLGWKFRKVRKRQDSKEEDDPLMFWGLSSVTTEENVAPRRVSRVRYH